MSKLDEAIAVIKAGDIDRGRRLLVQVLDEEPRNAKAWLWMSGVVSDPERRRQSLLTALEIEPDNEIARRGLEKFGWLEEEPVAEPPPAPAEEALEPSPVEEQEAPDFADDVAEEYSLAVEEALEPLPVEEQEAPDFANDVAEEYSLAVEEALEPSPVQEREAPDFADDVAEEYSSLAVEGALDTAVDEDADYSLEDEELLFSPEDEDVLFSPDDDEPLDPFSIGPAARPEAEYALALEEEAAEAPAAQPAATSERRSGFTWLVIALLVLLLVVMALIALYLR